MYLESPICTSSLRYVPRVSDMYLESQIQSWRIRFTYFGKDWFKNVIFQHTFKCEEVKNQNTLVKNIFPLVMSVDQCLALWRSSFSGESSPSYSLPIPQQDKFAIAEIGNSDIDSYINVEQLLTAQKAKSPDFIAIRKLICSHGNEGYLMKGLSTLW